MYWEHWHPSSNFQNYSLCQEQGKFEKHLECLLGPGSTGVLRGRHGNIRRYRGHLKVSLDASGNFFYIKIKRTAQDDSSLDDKNPWIMQIYTTLQFILEQNIYHLFEVPPYEYYQRPEKLNNFTKENPADVFASDWSSHQLWGHSCCHDDVIGPRLWTQTQAFVWSYQIVIAWI